MTTKTITTNSDGDTAELTEAGVAPSTGADLFGGLTSYAIAAVALVVGFVAIGGVAILDSVLLAMFPPKERKQ